MKLVHYLQWESRAVNALKSVHPEVSFVEAASAEDAARELADADALLVAGPYFPGPVGRAVNGAAPKLRWVQSSSIGTDKIEEGGGVPPHVAFTNAAGLKGRTVAEHAMALMLAHVHAVPLMERHRQDRAWSRDSLRHTVYSVERMCALLLGYGSIGREVARKAKAFDMEVIALNRTGEGNGPADGIGRLKDLAEWLPKADFVIASLPLTDETRHLLGRREFAAMKPGAVLVNVGRGAVVEHAALVEALAKKRLAAACLDVYEHEPLPADDPLWACENVVLSPHVAATGGPLGERFAELVSENLTRFRSGGALVNRVEIGKGGSGE